MNTGMKVLTVTDEQVELEVIGQTHSGASLVKAAQLRGHRIVFGFFQDDFNGGRIPYWHVCDPSSKSFGSTLSIEGLKLWKIIK